MFANRFIALKLALIVAFFAGPSAHAFDFPKTAMSRKEQVEHLLNRAAFGPRAGEIEELVPPQKLESWLEAQFHPESIDDSVVEAKLKALKSTTLSGPELFQNYIHALDASREALNSRHISSEFQLRKLVLAAESKREFERVLIDFWFNHFSIDRHFPHYVPLYERQAIAPHVFGHFEDLLIAVAQHPGMLFFLNTYRSTKRGATLSHEDREMLAWESSVPFGHNDNFAREVLELHTVGSEAGYTEKDISATALVFTGWTIAKEAIDPHFAYISSWHDETDVTILGHHYSGKKGLAEGLQLLHDLAMNPHTAERISKKLCLRFVADPAPPGCVSLLKRTYLESNGDLSKIYRTIFSSTEFWDPKNRLARFKGPFEFAASALRAVDSNLQITPMLQGKLNVAMNESGAPPYSCKAPSGYPETDAAWKNSASTMWRMLNAPMLIGLAGPKSNLTARDLVSPEFQKR